MLALLAGAALLVLATAGPIDGPHSAPVALAQPDAPTWPSPALVDRVRRLLLEYYGQRADPDNRRYWFRAPEYEVDKETAWKDPDTLWEHYGGPGTRCHAAADAEAFRICAGRRLAASTRRAWDGNPLFEARRGYLDNEGLAQMAGYFALYHAFVHDFEARDAPHEPRAGDSRERRGYHRLMIQAYEGHQRDTILRMLRDTRADPRFQADLTRSVGGLADGYARTVEAMEELEAWAAPEDRKAALAILSGLLQRAWWEWMVPQPDGPRTAGFADIGSEASFRTALALDPSWSGSDRFLIDGAPVLSLRPADHDTPGGPLDGLWFDADYALPGEWWCRDRFPAGSAESETCMAHARRSGLGGTKSPFGQYWGKVNCQARSFTPSGVDCGVTNLGSIAEEWLWTHVGARAAAHLLASLEEAGDPDLPAGSIGARVLDRVTDRLGYGVAGWHGGDPQTDDLEWKLDPERPEQAIRTLSAGRHDDSPQGGRFSLGERDDLPGISNQRNGDTWDDDRQEYAGGMENHLPGPSSLYGTLLFSYVLSDQTSDGPSPSLYDAWHRNSPDEFNSWLWLMMASYHRCPDPPGDDPSNGACFAAATDLWPQPARIARIPLYATPDTNAVSVDFQYLWRNPDTPVGPALPPSSVAAGNRRCRGEPGLPWRRLHDLSTGEDSEYLTDEGGFGAWNELIQGYGGMMRLLAARYDESPVRPEDEATYAVMREQVIAPWYASMHDQVAGILDVYGADFGYVPDIENATCVGVDPDPDSGGVKIVLPWQVGTADSVYDVTVRRATWYSIAALWYYWYDSDWLDIDADVWAPPPTPTPTATATATPDPRVAAAAAALPYAAGFPPGGDPPRDPKTGIQVQNLDAARPVSLTLRFIARDDPALPPVLVDSSAPPAGAANLYVPALAAPPIDLPFGVYAALIDVFPPDAPIGALVRSDWEATRGAAIYTAADASPDVLIPLAERVVRRPPALDDAVTTRITVQNAGRVATTVDVVLTTTTGVAAPPTFSTSRPIRPGASVTLSLADPSFDALGDGWRGWLRLRSRNGAPLVAQAYTAVQPATRTLHAVHGFEGVPASQADTTLFVPLFRAAQRGASPADRLDTEIAVVNAGNADALVRIDYRGGNPANPACDGQIFAGIPVTIAVGAAHVFDQAPEVGVSTGEHGLPARCFGSAVLRSTDAPIAATIVDRTNGRRLLASYNAVPAASAATRVALPLFRRAHVDLTTGIQVMNVGAVTVTARVAFTPAGGAVREPCRTGCVAKPIPPGGSATWWPGVIDAIEDGTYGSAVVTADGPVVVLVNDYPLLGQVDPATYIGLGLR